MNFKVKTESIERFYAKHKIFCYKQINNNHMTYDTNVTSDHSFIKHFKKLDEQISTVNSCHYTKESIKKMQNIRTR